MDRKTYLQPFGQPITTSDLDHATRCGLRHIINYVNSSIFFKRGVHFVIGKPFVKNLTKLLFRCKL